MEIGDDTLSSGTTYIEGNNIFERESGSAGLPLNLGLFSYTENQLYELGTISGAVSNLDSASSTIMAKILPMSVPSSSRSRI